MKPRHQATSAAVELIKRFEGFRAKAAQLPDGRWTIGYGHTRTARAGAEVTEADADALLIYDLAAVVTAINEWVFSPLTQNQFDALAAFVFNIGAQNFRRASVLRRLNEGAHLQAACAMEMWRTAEFEGERIVVDALVRRRSAEMNLFLTPQDGFIPVPSLIVVPRVDDALAHRQPVATAEVSSPLEGELAAATRADVAEPPLASRVAADAVAARLSALLNGPVPPELEPVLRAMPARYEPAPAEEPPLVGAPVPPPEEVLVAAPLVEEPVVAAIEAEPVVVEAAPEPASLGPIVVPLADSQPIAFRRRIAGTLGLRRKKDVPEPVLVLMGVAGLGIAGGGVFWGFDAHAAERLPLLPDPQMTGLGVSLAGVALLVASVYFLLTRLAMRDY